MKINCLLILFYLSACGGTGGSGVENGEIAGQRMKLRWFPVDDAESYVIHVEDSLGGVLFDGEVKPNGCTHRLREGYTTGLCDYSFPTPFSKGEYRLGMKALNNSGQSRESRLELSNTF